LKTVQSIEAGTAPSIPQVNTGQLKSAPKIFKETCEVNWNKSAREVYNFVRGLSPYPTAWTTLNGKFFKIYKTSIVDEHKLGSAGEVTSDGKSFIHIQCGSGVISLLELQVEGKKRMTVEEFLRGNKI
jgi:methionyl-tRNA formyltransferase